MSDATTAWINERREAHTAATEGPWGQNGSLFGPRGSEVGQVWGVKWRKDQDAIVNAHNTLPRALDALEAVLELHEPINGFVGDPSHWECNVCGDERGPKRYPCPTVQAIEEAIRDE